MKSIVLTRGKYALVDDADYEWLNQWKWNCNTRGYAVRMDWSGGRNNPKYIYMHRLLMGMPEGRVVDHISGDKLDNRKFNLRVCSQAQNCANSKVSKNSKSGYKGVYWYRAYQKWTAKITVNRKDIFLGYFDNLEEAVTIYNEAALKYNGKFAKLNEVKL